MKCNLCPRRCGAERSAQPGGACGLSATPRISRAALHLWEEPPISGVNGTGAVFFSGCSLGCVFCQNYEISHGAAGRETTPAELAEIFRRLEGEGAHSISLITGTHFAPAIIKALELYRPPLPVVWNTGGYETTQTIRMLAPYIDVWLPDYKYGLSEAAARYSRAPDYPETALAAIKEMRRAAPENLYEDGLLKKGVLVRHLVLPGNTRSSIAALERLAAELPGLPVSLMSQYTPILSGSQYPELERRITRREYDKVCARLLELGMDGFTQELDSSDRGYIPKWDNGGE